MSNVWDPNWSIDHVFDQIKSAPLPDVRSRQQAIRGVLREIARELDIYQSILAACEKRIEELESA